MKILMLSLFLMSASQAFASRSVEREYVRNQVLRERSLPAESAVRMNSEENAETLRSIYQGRPDSWEPPAMNR